MQLTTTSRIYIQMSHRQLPEKRIFRKAEMLWRAILPATVLIGFCAIVPVRALAGCPSSASRAGMLLAMPFELQNSGAGPELAPQSRSNDDFGQEPRRGSIVGFWSVTFYTDGNVWDQGFDQFFSDGNELMLDNAVPPSFGNVCVGVWKQNGDRSYKLKHLAWNFDAAGHVIGKGVLLETITVDANGNAYHGSFTARNYDLSDNQLDETKGEFRATRITVD